MEDVLKVENVSGVQKRISITVSPENVERKFEEFFKSIKNTAEVKGFRKGKAPLSALRAQFSKRAKPMVSQMLVGEYYSKAVRENGINVTGNPNFVGLTRDSEYPGTFNTDSSYCVDILVDVVPKLDVIGYDSLSLDLSTESESAVYDAKLLSYREQFAERKQILERGAQLGDALVIDFKGFVDGTQFEGGTAEGYAINKLGSANFIPSFEEQLVDVKAGDGKRISVRFPEDYRVETLAGKNAEFDVTVHSVVESVLAQVDNDLAMMVGFTSTEEFENHVRQSAREEYLNRVRNTAERQIVGKLKELNPFEVPHSMIREEQAKILQQAGVKSDGITTEMARNVFGLAKYNVEKTLLFDSIYEKESSLEVNPEELNNLLDEYASKYNKTKDEFVSMLSNTKQMDSFIGILKTKKVVDYIIERSKNALASEVSK